MKPRELAQQTALRGETDAAVEQLTALLAGGDLGAAASLAEIATFRGQWADVIRHAFAFMRRPDSVYAGNVLTDVTNLVALAGLEKGGWSEIQAEATKIRAELLADPKLAKYVNGTTPASSQVDQLIELAENRGKARYNAYPTNVDDLDEDVRVAKYEAGVVHSSKKKNAFKDEGERRRHYFALARVHGSHRSAVRLYDEEGIADLRIFDVVAFAAKSLARAGRAKDAWQAIEKGFHLWWPVDVAQVVPVVLLADEELRHLMTPERREWILCTPRGPAAAAKKT